MGHLSRLPNSNDRPSWKIERWADTNECVDLTALILSGDVHRCALCDVWARPKYLINGLCPDCHNTGTT